MKKEDDWIKETDKKIIHYIWTIFLSMMISIITTLSVVALGKTNDKTRYCSKCFSELPEDANYCPKCGKCMREQFKYEQGYIGEKSKTVTVGFQDKAIKL